MKARANSRDRGSKARRAEQSRGVATRQPSSRVVTRTRRTRIAGSTGLALIKPTSAKVSTPARAATPATKTCQLDSTKLRKVVAKPARPSAKQAAPVPARRQRRTSRAAASPAPVKPELNREELELEGNNLAEGQIEDNLADAPGLEADSLEADTEAMGEGELDGQGGDERESASLSAGAHEGEAEQDEETAEAEAEPEREEEAPRKAAGLNTSEEGLLASYFQDLGRCPPLGAVEQERALSEIASLEEETWARALEMTGGPQAVDTMVDALLNADNAAFQAARSAAGLEPQLGAPRRKGFASANETERKAMRAALAAARSPRRTGSPAKATGRAGQSTARSAATRAAGMLRRLDTDQSLVDAVLAKLSFDERSRTRSVRRYTVSTKLRDLMRARRRARLAKHRFVQANLRLVVHVALRYGRGLLPLADRIQEGNLGLMRAVDLFDPNRGAKFSTYASLWIRQAIARAVAEARSPVHVPASTGELMRAVGRLDRQLTTELGRRPERSELAQASGIDVDRLEAIMASANPEARSLDAPRHDEDDRALSDLLADLTAVSPEQGAIQSHAAMQVGDLLDKLRPREKLVLMARFGMESGRERTLEEIARELNLTRERVRQIQNEGLAKLRRMATHLAE